VSAANLNEVPTQLTNIQTVSKLQTVKHPIQQTDMFNSQQVKSSLTPVETRQQVNISVVQAEEVEPEAKIPMEVYTDSASNLLGITKHARSCTSTASRQCRGQELTRSAQIR
jgi:hypothetical protein